MVRTLSDLPYCMAKQQMVATTKSRAVSLLSSRKESSILPQCLVYDFLTNNEDVEEESAKDAASGVYLGSSLEFFNKFTC